MSSPFIEEKDIQPTPLVADLGHALFWQPEYAYGATPHGTIALLFWLVSALRPQACVSLDLSDAKPHFALCQALENIGSEGPCYVTFAAQADLPEPLAGYEAERHAHRSCVCTALPGDLPAEIEPGSIDLMLVSPAQGMALVSAEHLDALSDQAVVVVLGHADTETDQETDAAARDALCARFAHLDLQHLGRDVLILMVGAACPYPVHQVVQRCQTPEEHLTLSTILNRLDAPLPSASSPSTDPTETNDSAQIAALVTQNNILQAAMDDQAAELQTRFEELATLTRLLIDSTEETQPPHQAPSSSSEQAQTTHSLVAQNEALMQQVNTLDRENATRFKELAKLTQLIMTLQNALSDQDVQASAAVTIVDKAPQHAARQAAYQRNEALLSQQVETLTALLALQRQRVADLILEAADTSRNDKVDGPATQEAT